MATTGDDDDDNDVYDEGGDGAKTVEERAEREGIERDFPSLHCALTHHRSCAPTDQSNGAVVAVIVAVSDAIVPDGDRRVLHGEELKTQT
jgi:hypothetical protein